MSNAVDTPLAESNAASVRVPSVDLLCSDFDTARRWRFRRPHCGGWWLWRQRGQGRPEKILIAEDGKTVATNADYAAELGREPIDGENYWAGTNTHRNDMPGTWLQCD